MQFKVKTPENEMNIDVFYKFIKKEEIKTDRIVYADMCRKCKNYGQKYSCPPKSPDFNLICNKEGLFTVLFKCNLSGIRSTEYNKVRIANSVMKSRIDKMMRLLEKRFNTRYLSCGSCRLCKICNLKKCLPCKYPKDMRFSLEATGIDCNFLSKKLFDFPLLWYENNKAPEYTCVLAGLLTDEKESPSVEKELMNLLSDIPNSILNI